jgi:hypothetical protein
MQKTINLSKIKLQNHVFVTRPFKDVPCHFEHQINKESFIYAYRNSQIKSTQKSSNCGHDLHEEKIFKIKLMFR